MSLDKPMEVSSGDVTVELGKYQTVLIPAAAEWCSVRAQPKATAPFMFVTPPHERNQLAVRMLAAGVPQAEIDAFTGQF